MACLRGKLQCGRHSAAIRLFVFSARYTPLPQTANSPLAARLAAAAAAATACAARGTLALGKATPASAHGDRRGRPLRRHRAALAGLVPRREAVGPAFRRPDIRRWGQGDADSSAPSGWQRGELAPTWDISAALAATGPQHGRTDSHLESQIAVRLTSRQRSPLKE